MSSINLLSSTSRVETPFISVQIGDYTFGSYREEQYKVGNFIGGTKIVYPNYMQSIEIDKLNGQVNSYTIVMKYAIQYGDDPNFFEKVFSSISKDRKIKITYGDMSIPSFVYRDEDAIVTKIKSSVDAKNSTIQYTLTCTSNSLSLTVGTHSFPRQVDKPSNVIKSLLRNSKYGLTEIFYGMKDMDLVESRGLITSDDKIVNIEAQSNITVLQYLNYLINCMSNIADDDNALIKKYKYIYSTYEDLTNEFNGPYFKVVKISSDVKDINSLDTYTINVGFPDGSIVTDFSIDDDETYSLLYDYSKKIEQTDYIYRIDNNGETYRDYSPMIALSNKYIRTTETDKTWWTTVTQYPIKATLTIKGLLRPAVLMSYVKLNVLFYGQKHISSGTYVITKQVDRVDYSGYRTTLSLTRVSGDE